MELHPTGPLQPTPVSDHSAKHPQGEGPRAEMKIKTRIWHPVQPSREIPRLYVQIRNFPTGPCASWGAGAVCTVWAASLWKLGSHLGGMLFNSPTEVLTSVVMFFVLRSLFFFESASFKRCCLFSYGVFFFFFLLTVSSTLGL